jgi:hypothetical protein
MHARVGYTLDRVRKKVEYETEKRKRRFQKRSEKDLMNYTLCNDGDRETDTETDEREMMIKRSAS